MKSDRLRHRDGATFFGDPVIADPEPNGSLALAAQLAAPVSVLRGRIANVLDVDYYRIALQQGDTWKVGNAAAQAACQFDGLVKHTLTGKLGAVTDKTADFTVEGTAEGIEDGARVSMTVDAAGTFDIGRDERLALPQHRVSLPITCVEGWSSQADWEGVRIRDLVRMAGGDDRSRVKI